MSCDVIAFVLAVSLFSEIRTQCPFSTILHPMKDRIIGKFTQYYQFINCASKRKSYSTSGTTFHVPCFIALKWVCWPRLFFLLFMDTVPTFQLIYNGSFDDNVIRFFSAILKHIPKLACVDCSLIFIITPHFYIFLYFDSNTHMITKIRAK